MNARTKIVATIGPASESEEVLKKIILEGVDVARLNFSHNTHEWHGKIIDCLRKLSNELKMPISIMADLQGPRIRTIIDKEIVIEKGETIAVSDIEKIQNTKYEIQDTKYFSLDVPNIIDDIEVGNEIMIQDGLMKIVVREKNKDFLLAEVINGGTIGNHKGVNLPDSNIKLGALTEKDLNDLKFSLSKGVDLVAISFVKNAADLKYLREKIKEFSSDKNASVQIVPKIERKEALKNIDEIIDESDVVMVARGDLGIEMPESEVVIYQKEIVNKCREKNKPVIVATQMMESMMENPIPTRAEVSDISNAVIDHADFVMLSGESANGKYPTEAVKMMEEIIEKVEESPLDD